MEPLVSGPAKIKHLDSETCAIKKLIGSVITDETADINIEHTRHPFSVAWETSSQSKRQSFVAGLGGARGFSWYSRHTLQLRCLF